MGRKPIPRDEHGFWLKEAEGLEDVARKAVDELCALNPGADILDIELQFMHTIALAFTMKLASE